LRKGLERVRVKCGRVVVLSKVEIGKRFLQILPRKVRGSVVAEVLLGGVT
jgi:hypothetical protein